MVVNLCLPQFNTSVHCDKVCADGYDVTNLVSADPALRRRGFKLEYFLRPPVQVTLKFGFQVELCRVDVELWPWCMDQGHACKRLEISTSTDRAQVHKEFQQKEQMKIQAKGQNVQNRETQQQHGSKSRCSNGQQWSLQARQWGEEAVTDPQRTGHTFKCPSKPESNRPDTEFKLVGRCELKEETRVCFTRSNFSPRAPFHSPPPPQPANCRQEELWSRGLLSLGAVTQLRVMMPYGGAASALGIKTLAVWGQPARCCSAEEVQRIKRIHEVRKRNLLRPGPFVPSVSQAKPSLEETISPSNESIPEEFLDPITQEVMMLPMLLPCGMSVDNSTLEEHQKREATWGRAPNDPFTGVPFTSTSQPLPNPRLKHRIDRFLLQKGILGRDGMLGRQGGGENLQASRLIVTEVDGKTAESYNNSLLERGNKRHLNEDSKNELRPQTKRQRTDALPSCSSHEQRLSASLDEALFSALQGRPSFTSNLSLQRQFAPDSEPVDTLEECQTSNTPTLATDEERCCACSCSVSIYSKAVSSIYHLTCGHLLCRSCLQKESQPINTASISTSNHILCPACQRPTPRSHVLRVHR